MEVRAFLVHAQLDAGAGCMVAAGWLAPRREKRNAAISDIDIARAQLIHDLRRLGRETTMASRSSSIWSIRSMDCGACWRELLWRSRLSPTP